MKFTFKKHKPTGQYRSFYNAHHDIKYKRKVCGSICKGEGGWRVSLMAKKASDVGNPNCDWKWVHFKARFETDEEAREFINRPEPQRAFLETNILHCQVD